MRPFVWALGERASVGRVGITILRDLRDVCRNGAVNGRMGDELQGPTDSRDTKKEVSNGRRALHVILHANKKREEASAL